MTIQLFFVGVAVIASIVAIGCCWRVEVLLKRAIAASSASAGRGLASLALDIARLERARDVNRQQ